MSENMQDHVDVSNVDSIDVLGPEPKKSYTIYYIVICICILVTLVSVYYIFVLENKIQENAKQSLKDQNVRVLDDQKVVIQQAKKLPVQSGNMQDKVLSIWDKKQKVCYLTFDDGPAPGITDQILEVLKKENVPATFFVLGSNVQKYPNLVKRAYDEGHYIANHSYNHKYDQLYENPQNTWDQYIKTENAIKKVLGNNYNSYLFRFPGGSNGGIYADQKAQLMEEFKQKNIAFINWNCLTGDAEGNNDVESQFNKYLETKKDQDHLVILMHDGTGKKFTKDTLIKIIEDLKKQGYVFENFYDIFN